MGHVSAGGLTLFALVVVAIAALVQSPDTAFATAKAYIDQELAASQLRGVVGWV